MIALARSHPETDAVVDAINALTETDLDRFDAWQPLADLSSRTGFEMIDADPDGIVIKRDGRFEAIATVYVMLVYGSSRDEERMSDEYIATIRGRVDAGGVSIDSIAVNVDPFYT